MLNTNRALSWKGNIWCLEVVHGHNSQEESADPNLETTAPGPPNEDMQSQAKIVHFFGVFWSLLSESLLYQWDNYLSCWLSYRVFKRIEILSFPSAKPSCSHSVRFFVCLFNTVFAHPWYIVQFNIELYNWKQIRLGRRFMLLVIYHQSPVSRALFSDLKKIQENFVKEEGLWLLEILQDALLFSLLPVWEKAQEWVPQVDSVYLSSVFETLDIYSVPFRT